MHNFIVTCKYIIEKTEKKDLILKQRDMKID